MSKEKRSIGQNLRELRAAKSEREGKITQAELADINQKDRNVICKLIDKLESKKLVRRERGKQDRRSFSLYLTDDGASAVEKYWSEVYRVEKKQIERLSEEEQQTLLKLLEKISD